MNPSIACHYHRHTNPHSQTESHGQRCFPLHKHIRGSGLFSQGWDVLIVPDACQTIFYPRLNPSTATASYWWFASCLKASPHIHPAHMEMCLTKEAAPSFSAFTIQHLVSEMLLIACLPVSLGLGRNWYQLPADFQTMLPWQPPWKALSLEQKEWHCQLKSTRFSIYKFHCTQSWIHDQPSHCVCDVFNLLCGPLHLASECSSQGGFVLVVSTFFYFCRGLFDMQHCCTVIMLGLWLNWRLALSMQTPVRKPKCMKSCSHYCSF